MERMNGVLAIGLMFLFAGLMGFAIPDYTGGATPAAANAGDPAGGPPIPGLLSGGLLAAGAALIGLSLYKRR